MTIIKNILFLLFIICNISVANSQNTGNIKEFGKKPFMKGGVFACYIRDVESESSYGLNHQMLLTPASLMKLVTTATALDVLGKDFRYETSVCFDGEIANGTLHGNIYIKGSGDPTLGSSHFGQQAEGFINEWVNAIKQKGIERIDGAVIADESIFDTEGVSPKWLYEDLGNYYGAGSYGLSVFDNMYRLKLRSGNPGTKPEITGCTPANAVDVFHNLLKSAYVRSDSAYISGAPFSNERIIYGAVPANKESVILKGDIPDPALFLARYLEKELGNNGISASSPASCYRILKEEGKWKAGKRNIIVTTYSPALEEIISVTNHVSHNLYADALLKTIGLRYKPKKGEVISSFNRGIRIVNEHWKKKGLDISQLVMYDGSGLAPTDKTTAEFIGKILTEMYANSESGDIFAESLPLAGINGSVRNFMKNTKLQGKAMLKSGSMSGVRGYAGYIKKGDKTYTVVIMTNQFNCKSSVMTQKLGALLNQIF